MRCTWVGPHAAFMCALIHTCTPPGTHTHTHPSPLQALESDTRVLAYEAGRKYKVRVNTISAGPLGSRAAKAIGFIDDMIR